MSAPESGGPRARAVGVVDGRVVAVGDPEEVRARLPSGAARLAAPYVAPGFVDSHVHLIWAGQRATRLVLDDVGGLGELLDRLRAHAAANPSAQWLTADAGFDLDGRLPSAAELEAAVPGRGLLLDRKGHDALVNVTALRRAGIGPGTPDPPGGRIDRDAAGTPTGLLVERPAVDLVRAVLPTVDRDTRVGWIRAGQAELLRHGITTAVDPAVAVEDLDGYAYAARSGRLRMRVVAMPLGDALATDAVLDRAVARTGLVTADPARLRRGPTKLFLDGGGSLGTALLSSPWPGTDGYHGNQTLSVDIVHAHCVAAAGAGRGVGVHAVGDAAVDLVLDVLTDVDRRAPIAGLGFHLIHAYLGPSRAAMDRARRLGVRVSAHPALQWQVGAGLVQRLGAERAGAANPLRAWLDAGVEVGGGSDGPGLPMSALFGMWQARTRQVRGWPDPLGAGQAVTAAQALALFTTGAARIAGGPGTGRIRVGDPADLALLDVDPLTSDVEALRTATVVTTIVGGEVEYRA
ncbi:amidohydrolase [Micromonospora sp. NPDC057140]|uniref:amidohydrolase n=1 Tax=Micromonospora sp. NPDC057140 TaxID=3346032 RepID=UPI003632A514